MSPFRSLFIFALGISPLIACSSGDDGNKSYSTGLPPGATLGGLSDADMQTLCNSAKQYVASNAALQDAMCKFSGAVAASFGTLGGPATDAQVQALCASAYGACVSGFTGDAGTASCAKPAPSCTATIAEYETCTNDSIVLEENLAASIPACKDLKVSDLRSTDGGSSVDIESPASCKSLKAKCPELFVSR